MGAPDGCQFATVPGRDDCGGNALVSGMLAAIVGAAALCWLYAGLSVFFGNRRIPRLGDAAALAPDGFPTLTILAAAKDEALHVDGAARSLLAQDYPRLQVILVDDRSTDGTAAILDRLAALDPRLRVVHIETLPLGWIGKCHALSLGAESTDSAWLLFTDADVTLAPEAARRAVSLALRGGWDHVAVGPDMHIETLGEAVFVAAFVVIFNATIRPWLASDPRRREAIGIGAFNLVRRESYVRSGGHAKLRLELLDDMALGKILKQSGARQTMAGHDRMISVRWHYGVRGLIRGIEKNMFPAARYRLLPSLFAPWVLLAIAFAPYAGLFLPGPVPKIVALVAWLGVFLSYREASRTVDIQLWQALLMPLGVTLFVYSFVRSMVVTLAQGGVRWRGTLYSLTELKRGRVW